MGVYLEPVAAGELPAAELVTALLPCGGPLEAERFCDSDGDYQRKYNVYKLTVDGKSFVLKKSDGREVSVYRDFLQGRGFAVPEYLGSVEHGGAVWLLMEHISGPDLRKFDRDMASACAETLSRIQNSYWNSPLDGARFRRYWERINKRAECLEDYPVLAEAYRLFLERQRDCPRTLCSGDLLQCNGIWHDGRAYFVDWGFGGVMPYALDIARLIAHGHEEPEPYAFPFYMDGELRSAFVHAHYQRLEHKPDWAQYIRDIQLAALNEYVEFLEVLIHDPEVSREEVEADFYFRRAGETAGAILGK